MDLIQLIVILVVIGVIMYLVNRYIPMEARIKSILNVVVIIAVVLWLLATFLGFRFGNVRDIPVPTVGHGDMGHVGRVR